MKISLNTVKELTGLDLPPVDELVHRINQQLGAVEEVIELGDIYRDAKIVRVVECHKHPNADKLSVCKIDAGLGELVQVVCGAPNVHADMWAVWLPPESIVPSTYSDAEPFRLGARELRGIMSHGMLAAGDELAINNDHAGIVKIHDNDLKKSTELVPGQSFAETFGLNDTIINIENKMFTHRPDLFGQLGVAREISAILKGLKQQSEDVGDTRFVNPDWYWQMPVFETANTLPLEIFNDVAENVPRFMAVAMENIVVAPSPLWLQTTLLRWGSKSINNVVDVTNYIMLLTAQPTHAYDYDKLIGHKLGARMANDNEAITLLNGKTYHLTPDDIVIADGGKAVGLAGIMGSGTSEVDDKTERIVLEVASFDMYKVRKSSMRHGVFTDALTRFNKGQSYLQNGRVLAELMQIIRQLTGAKQASNVFDLPDKHDQLDEPSINGAMTVSASFINDRLGLDLETQQIGDLLRRVNFASYPPGDDPTILEITAPFWRTDIEQPEDVVEEVGRLYGFDKLPRELPRRFTAAASKLAVIQLKQTIRRELEKTGANEVLTYSFVHEQIIKKAGQDPTHAFGLSNALSPDLQYYRLSVLPSLLDKVQLNVRAGYREFRLFEIGKAHFKGVNDRSEPELPAELERLATVLVQTDAKSSPFYDAKLLLEHIVGSLNIKEKISYLALDTADLSDYPAFYEATRMFAGQRSAVVYINNQLLGVVGEYRNSVIKDFKLPNFTAGFEIDLEVLVDSASRPNYRALSRYPSISNDLSLKVSGDTSYQQVYDGLEQILSREVGNQIDSGVYKIEPVTIYQPEQHGDKTITIRVEVASGEETLRDEQVNRLLDQSVSKLAEQINLTRI